MNLPNKLTLLRALMVPVVVVVLLITGIPHRFLIAGILFGIASYTDHLDGKLARKNNQITDFGKFMDPLADKLLVIAVLVCFVELGVSPAWCVILIIARELMVTSIRLVAAGKGSVIAANNWGKAKTVSQIAAIGVIFAVNYLAELSGMGILPSSFAADGSVGKWCGLFGLICLLIATLLTLVSGMIYLVQNFDVIRQAK